MVQYFGTMPETDLPVLYHADRSSSSQVCRLALAEKGIAHGSKLLTLRGDQYDPDFLRLVSPRGTVPVLEHEGRYFRDSKEIVDYVDKLQSEKPSLRYDDNTKIADKVRYFTYRVRTQNLPVLTYGAIFMRDFTTDCMAPDTITRGNVNAATMLEVSKLYDIQADNPDLAPIFRLIVQRQQDHALEMCTEHELIDAIEECDKAFEDIEAELMKRKNQSDTCDVWLCGDRFTLADIYLSVLLHRLTFVGLADRLFLSKRPLLTDYYQHVLKRPSFIAHCGHVNESRYWVAQRLRTYSY